MKKTYVVKNGNRKGQLGSLIARAGNEILQLLNLRFSDGDEVYPIDDLEEVKTENCTPTWSGLLPVYIENFLSSNPLLNVPAKKELGRMAEIADRYNDLAKEHEECLASYKRSTYNALESMSVLIDCIEHPEKVNDNIRLRIDGVKLLIAEYRDAKAAEDSAASN